VVSGSPPRSSFRCGMPWPDISIPFVGCRICQ
jgi:hypothetical protein